MKLLLDTHAWIWSIIEPERLTPEARDVVEDGDSAIHVSAISFWELAMLEQRGRFDVDGDVDGWIDYARRELPIVELPITSDIALESRRLDLAHRDPADRFLAATCRRHDLTLVTRDAQLIDFAGIETIVA